MADGGVGRWDIGEIPPNWLPVFERSGIKEKLRSSRLPCIFESSNELALFAGGKVVVPDDGPAPPKSSSYVLSEAPCDELGPKDHAFGFAAGSR